MTKKAAPKSQLTIDEMLRAVGLNCKGVELKEENEVMDVLDVTEPAAASELDSEVIEAIRKVRKAMYPICWFQIVDYRNLVDENSMTHEGSLSDHMYSVVSNPRCSARSGQEGDDSDYDVPTLKAVANATELCKGVIRLGAQCHLFRSALQFGQWYKILSGAKGKENCGSHGGEDIATKDGEDKKAVFEVQGVPLRYTREVGCMMTSILGSRADQIDIFEQSALFRRKRSSCGHMLRHMKYEWHGKVTTRHPS